MLGFCGVKCIVKSFFGNYASGFDLLAANSKLVVLVGRLGKDVWRKEYDCKLFHSQFEKVLSVNFTRCLNTRTISKTQFSCVYDT